VERYNERTGTVRGPGMASYVGEDVYAAMQARGEEKTLQRMLDNVDGYTLKDQAMYDAHVSVGRNYIGPQKATTPEERGVPRWSGTPEEAARIVRAALRHFGAATIGIVELDDNLRKFVYSVDPDGKEIIFTDDPIASETEEARFLPYAAKYAIMFTVQMSQETLRRAPTPIGAQTTSLAYKRSQDIQASMQEFLRGSGDQGLSSASTNALLMAVPLGIYAGLGELSRINRLVTPEFGPMVRVFGILTDLPLATDKPIDAGILEFCKSCKKCAEACPSESLSFEDEPTWEVRGGWNNPGHKAWFEDSTTCMAYWREEAGTNCGICFAVCPFSKKDSAWVHDWVKAGISSVPAAGSLFRSMDDAFGYGAAPTGESWWSLDLPEYGIDTTQTVTEV
jgi:reductive dehalogenase